MGHHITSRLSVDSAADPKSGFAPDPAEIAALLNDLTHVPLTELPDGPARNLLATAIRLGLVDGLYRPFGAPYYILTLAGMPPSRDARIPLAAWRELTEAFTAVRLQRSTDGAPREEGGAQ